MNGLYAPTFRIFTGQIKQNLFIGQKCFPPVACIKDKFCVNLAKAEVNRLMGSNDIAITSAQVRLG